MTPDAPAPYGPAQPWPQHVAPPAPPRRSRRWLWVALGVALVLMVGGATAAGLALRGDAEPAAQPSPSATPLGRVSDPMAVLSELERRGAEPCRPYTEIAHPVGALVRGRCFVGTDEVDVGVYTDQAGAEAQYATMTTMMRGVSPVHMVIGPNWTIGGEATSWLRRAAELLGGTYREA